MHTARTPLSPSITSTPLAGRIAAFLYGISSYAIGVSGLVWLILCTLDLAPFTGGPLALGSVPAAIALNVLLVAAFGIQHAIMARPGFKERWTRIVPACVERSTFVLLAGLLMGTAMWLWQPLDATIWSIEAPLVRGLLRGLCALGWAYLLAATFAIDHFELFGLRQVWLNLRGRSPEPVRFVQRLMYRFDRHPIMSGVLVGLWATPTMRLDHLVLALAFTGYVIIGVAIEERDLLRVHGDAYREYKREVRSLVPTLGR